MKVEIQKEMKELLESTDKIERNLVPKIQADYSLLKREVKESRNEVEQHGKGLYELKREFKELGSNLEKGRGKITSLEERLGA